MPKTETLARIKEMQQYVVNLFNSVRPGEIKVVSYGTEKKILGSRVDMIVKLEVLKNKYEAWLELKSRGEPAFLYQAITQLKTLRKRYAETGKPIFLFVVAPFISKFGRQVCKDNNINFIDLSGNYSISITPFSLEKTGEENKQREQKVLKNLFAPKASRIIRVLLENPGKSWSLRQLAKEAGISASLAHHVFNKLRNYQFVDRNNQYKIFLEENKKSQILDSWAEKYTYNDNKIHPYYSFQRSVPDLLKKIALVAKEKNLEYAATMHAGASLISPFVRFNDTHIYVKTEDIETWVKELDLRAVEAGANFYLMEPIDEGVFYKIQVVDKIKVACNTQLYLDLINYPQRGKEQAEVIRKEKLKY